MAEFLTNTFCLAGIYTVIVTVWRIIELRQCGTLHPRKRDNYIAGAVSIAMMVALAVMRNF